MFPGGVRQLLGRGKHGRLGAQLRGARGRGVGPGSAAGALVLPEAEGNEAVVQFGDRRAGGRRVPARGLAARPRLQRERGDGGGADLALALPAARCSYLVEGRRRRAFCDHLEAVDEDLDCDADEADAEFCARLLTPALRPALDDDNVRAQFRCGGAARRGEKKCFVVGFRVRARGMCSTRRRGRASRFLSGVCCQSRALATPTPPGRKRARR